MVRRNRGDDCESVIIPGEQICWGKFTYWGGNSIKISSYWVKTSHSLKAGVGVFMWRERGWWG